MASTSARGRIIRFLLFTQDNAERYSIGTRSWKGLKVLLQMSGVLVLAAGVGRAFEHQDVGLITLGYVIMRVGLVAGWLRAARADVAVRRTARRRTT